jgi:hypothetical protein
MYRTLLAMVVLLILLKLYELFESRLGIPTGWSIYILTASLLVIFLFSYIKQSQYIAKRIKSKNQVKETRG